MEKRAVKHCLMLVLCMNFGLASAQQRGQIIKAGDAFLDPNQDGWVSTNSTGFSNDGYYVDEFELNMFGMPISENGEIADDIQNGSSCGTTDLSADNEGFTAYGLLDNFGNLIFRFRLGGDRPSIEAYTVLIDADGKFGTDDPNATANNPGFEIDITLIENKGVLVYNLDGIEGCPNDVLSYSKNTHYQRSVAGTENCGDADYFFDFYVPFDDLIATFPQFNLSLQSEMRFFAVTNISATCAMGGSISDIGGVNDDDFAGCNVCAFQDLSDGQCPTALEDLVADGEGFSSGTTPKPEINAPVKVGETVLSGTSVPGANIFVDVYDATRTLVDEVTVVSTSAGEWISPLNVALQQQDSITARAQLEGGCTSGVSDSDVSFAIVIINTPPVLSGSSGTLDYNENDGAIPIDPAINISDIDDVDIDEATISIVTSFQTSEDLLVFTDQSGITGSYNSSSGVLSLTGQSSLANYITALSSVAYQNDSDNPSSLTRQVEFIINDGLDDSNIITRDINVIPVNDPPIILGSNSPILYANGDGTVLIDDQIMVSDPDHSNLTGGTVSISNNFVTGEDFLAFTNQNGITGSFDGATGILTLTGSALVADYQAALASITYEKTGLSSILTRRISFVLSDGVDNSSAFQRDIDIDNSNQPPVIEDGGIPVTSINRSTDEDVPFEICIEATDPDGDMTIITSVISLDGSGELEISATDPMCFTYTPPLNFSGTETIQVEVCDQSANSLCDQVTVVITVDPVNDLPLITGSNTDLLYTNGDGEVVIDDQINITDEDHTQLTGATVSITNNFVTGDDILGFSNQNGITGSYDGASGILTLSGSATLEHYSTALASVSYNKTGTSSILTRQLSFVVSDGTDNSAAFIRNIDISTVNQPPQITDGGVPVSTINTSTNEDTAFQICIEATDPDGDATSITSLTSLDGTGGLVISSTDPMCFTYTPPADFSGIETIQVEVCDQNANSLCDQVNVVITVDPVNDPPIITGTSSPLLYTNGDGAVIIDNNIAITDKDNTSLAGGTVSISSNFLMGEDVLAFSNQNGITGSFNSTTGVLTLSGTTSITNYITALQSITYEKTGSASDLTRQISFVISDGTDNSQSFIRDMDINNVNQPPVITDGGVPATTINRSTDEDTPFEICVEANDPDGDQTIITSVISLDGNGTFEISLIDPMCFTYTPETNFSGTETIQVEVCDQTANSLCDQVDIVITVDPINDLPVISGTNSALLYTNGDGEVPVDDQITVSDEDNVNLAGGTVSITNNFVQGEDVLAFSDQNGISGSYNPTNGILTLTGSALLSEYATALSSVTYEKTGTTSILTRQFTFIVSDGFDNSEAFIRNINIDNTNQPPVIEVGGNPVTSINANTDEDTPLLVSIEASDPDGDMTAISSITSLDGMGTFEISATDPMDFTYTPQLNFSGQETLQVEICDQTVNSLCDQVDVVITVNPINDLPVITGTNTPLIYSNGNGAVVIDGGVNISDADNTDITGGTVSISNNYLIGEDLLAFSAQNGISGVFDAPSGVLTLSGTASLSDYASALGSITYEKTGLTSILTRQITFIVSDGTDNSLPFRRDMDINDSNQPPVIEVGGNPVTTINVTTDEDTPLEICLEASDPDGDMTAIGTAISLDGGGTFNTSNPNPMCFTYIPVPDFNGQETIQVEVCDQAASSLCDVVNIIVTVLPVNDPPTIPEVGNPVDTIRFVTQEEVTLEDCLLAGDPDLNILDITSIISKTNGGSYDLGAANDLCFSFNPETDFSGEEISTFTVCDDGNPQLCDDVVVVIDVSPINDPPVIVDAQNNPVDTLFFTTKEDFTVGICVDISDPDFGPWSIETINEVNDIGTTELSIVNSLCYSFIPDENATGQDIRELVVCDAGTESLCDTVVIVTTILPVNDEPVIEEPEEDIITNEDEPVNICLDVEDFDTDQIAITDITSDSENGTYEFDGVCFTFTPNEDFFGEEQAIITVCDNGDPQLCDEIVIDININSVNDAPIAIDDEVTVLRNRSVTANVLENDSDLEGNNLSVNLPLEAVPLHGNLEIDAAGNFTYTPDPAFFGDDAFSYTVCDDGDPRACSSANVFITVENIEILAYEGFSPNNDSRNDYWRIEGIDLFENNFVRLYDRYNNLIFEIAGYNNEDRVWQGESNNGVSKKDLPDGTYFYVINLGDGDKLISGFVVLKRS